MYKILVLGKAGECSHSEHIKELDGIYCQDNFVDYISNDNLRNKMDTGYLHFVVVKDVLYSKIIYFAKEELSDVELEELKNYTSGQLSDGIGKIFEQSPCHYIDDEEVYISAWYQGQVLTITQNEI